MAAEIVVEERPQNDSLEAFSEHLHSIIKRHAKAATHVRIERRNRGPGSGPILSHVKLEKKEEETDDEHATSSVDLVVKLIVADSKIPRGRNNNGVHKGTVGPWEGAAVVINEKAAKVADKKLGEAPLIIVDPDAYVDDRSEILGVMKEMREFLSGMSRATVAERNAGAKVARQHAKVVKAVAKQTRKGGKSAGKWKYRGTKEQEKTKRKEEEERARTKRNTNFYDTVQEISEDHATSVELWSKWFTRERKPGEGKPGMPTRPTADEVEKICVIKNDAGVVTDTRFEDAVEVSDGDGGRVRVSLRGTISEMIAEPDVKRRLDLAAQLGRVIKAMDDVSKALLRARTVHLLGEERADSIAAWLSLPIT